MSPGTLAGRPAVGTARVAIVSVGSGWWAMGPRPVLEASIVEPHATPAVSSALWSELAGGVDPQADLSLVYVGDGPLGLDAPVSVGAARGAALSVSVSNGLEGDLRVEFGSPAEAAQAVAETEALLGQALGSAMAAMSGFDVLESMIHPEASGSQARVTVSVPDGDVRTLLGRVLMMLGS